MEVIKLEENYWFAIEPPRKRVRPVVFLSGVEKVCRLKTREELRKFPLPDENHLFSGRLQAAKTAPGISIWEKANRLG